MATKIKLNQLENSTTAGSIAATNGSNVLTHVAPPASSVLWGYDHGETATVYVNIGTNLSYDAGTNTLNASAGAGGYATIQEESGDLTARTKMAFIGSGLTAADDAGNSRTTITLNTFLNTLATAGNINLATVVTGTLPVANGGTGATTLTGLLQGNGTSAITAITNSSTVGQVLRVTNTNTYAWGALDLADTDAVTGVLDEVNGGTGQSTITTGDLLQGTASNTLGKLAAVATGNALISGGVGTASSWGKIGLTTHVSGTLPIANGGTGSATQNFVDLTTNQTIGGDKTFSNNVILSGTASLDSHAVNLGVLKTYITGMDGKQSVRVATTAAGTLASSFENGDTVDGVTLATNDRILIKDQSSSAENGIYTVNASGAPTRATDMDSWTEVPGSFVAVEEGTVNADTVWLCTSNQGGTLGSTAIVWSKWKAAGTGIDGSGAQNKVAYFSDADTITTTTNFHFNGTQLAVGTATPVTSTIFTTQGTGTGNTTFGYQHNNSSSAQVFRVADDGRTIIGASGDQLVLTPTSIFNSTNSIVMAGGVSVTLQSGGTSSTGAQAIFDATRTITSGSSINGLFSGSFAPTSGTATNTQIDITSTVNQTGGANGITRGMHIHQTLTAQADYRGLEITAHASHYALWSTLGKVRFDLGSDATGDVYYRGAGGEMTRLGIGSNGYVLTLAAGLPTWAAPAGGTKTVGYVTGTGTTTYDLDSGSIVKDVDGATFAFTVPTNLDLVDVYRNGVMLSRSGTVTRDYTIVSATGVLTLVTALGTDEELKIVKNV
jgi:hypothetical protein